LDAPSDPGLDLITRLPRRIRLDEHWLQRNDRGFVWWPHRLAQRVWSEPLVDYHGTSVSRVHIETDVLRDIERRAEAVDALVPLNRVASLSHLAIDRSGWLRLHASLAVTSENLNLVGPLAVHVLSLQAADAHVKAAPLSEFLSAPIADSRHPTHGARSQPDDLLDALAYYADKGRGDSPYTAIDIAQLTLMQPRPWVMARSGGDGLDAELPFTGERPSILSGSGGAPETALLQIRPAHRHPQLGAGALLRLALPARAPAAIANDLNLAEAHAPEGHQLGAWTIDRENLAFYTFLPAVAFTEDIIPTLIWHAAARALWARTRLLP
jgi:hypothetical protein